jgi:DNA modification methylase
MAGNDDKQPSLFKAMGMTAPETKSSKSGASKSSKQFKKEKQIEFHLDGEGVKTEEHVVPVPTEEQWETISEAREDALEIKKKYGGEIPDSIIRASFKKLQLDDMMSGRSRGEEMRSQHGELTKVLGPSGSSKAHSVSISRFPWNVGETIIKMFTEKGDYLLDPFAGHNSRMEIAYRNGRNYHGFDICEEFVDWNHKVLESLKAQQDLFGNQLDIEVTLCDSREMPIRENFYDLCMTSPPYWDMEYYGPEAGQLYNDKSYQKFMFDIETIIDRCFQSLKHGARIAWFINDFRRGKKFYLYHADIARAFQNVGFELSDILIVDLGRSIRGCFPNQFEKYKLFPKRHEYGVIGIKP